MNLVSDISDRIEKAWTLAEKCVMCPNRCEIDRRAGNYGICKLSNEAIVSSAFPHHGEERPIRGYGGSGTIFFSGCNLLCDFCQNMSISHYVEGKAMPPEVIAQKMLDLQKQGCENINFVTPSHVVPIILEALQIAYRQGLQLPLIYNSSGYDAVEALELLDGVIDIYMPDFKFWSPDFAERLTGKRDYPEIARAAVKEMHRQVGDLQIDKSGVAVKGLLVRHLVLPNDRAGTEHIMKFLHDEISPETYVNIMGQYHPYYKAEEYPEISRGVLQGELKKAKQMALKAGLTNLVDS